MINRDVLTKGRVVVAHITEQFVKTVAGETPMEMHLIRTVLDNPLCWSPASAEADAAGLRGNAAGGAEENYAGLKL